MRYLTFAELLELHRRVVAETGGATALRDLGALESATAQPRASFGGNDLYPSIEEKAAALAFSLIQNHPFIDGNKRAGHAALETYGISQNVTFQRTDVAPSSAYFRAPSRISPR